MKNNNTVSVSFMLLGILFCVCLVAANLLGLFSEIPHHRAHRHRARRRVQVFFLRAAKPGQETAKGRDAQKKTCTELLHQLPLKGQRVAVRHDDKRFPRAPALCYRF